MEMELSPTFCRRFLATIVIAIVALAGISLVGMLTG